VYNDEDRSEMGDLIPAGAKRRYEETGMLDRTHLQFFTRSGINTLFSDAGYEIVELYPFNQHTATGRAAAILRLFGHRFDDLLAMHFAVAAVPSSGVSG
jgi:hypothetical protein